MFTCEYVCVCARVFFVFSVVIMLKTLLFYGVKTICSILKCCITPTKKEIVNNNNNNKSQRPQTFVDDHWPPYSFLKYDINFHTIFDLTVF